MLKFRYKLKLDENVAAKCSRHPRYNPEHDGTGGIRGQCTTCWDLYNLYKTRLDLDRAVRDFLRHAAPWTKYRERRKKKAPAKPDSTIVPPEDNISVPPVS